MNLIYFRWRLQKLPDKGQRIQDLYDRAVKALDLKNEIDTASNLLSALNLGSKDIDDIEWKDHAKIKKYNELDSDDDEDPIAILVSSNTVTKNQRIVKQSDDDDDNQLITEEDIKEAREVAKNSLHLDPVLEHVCQNEKMEPAYRFLPCRPKPNSLNSSTSSLSSLEGTKKIRDNTAASPPVLNQGTISITLRESMEIENQHRQKLKELHETQASERLAIKVKELGEGVLKAPLSVQKRPDASFMNKYRVATLIDEDDDEDREEPLSDDGNSDE